MFGYLLIFIAACLWALLGIFTAFLLDAQVQAMEIAFWRAVIAGAMFIAHAAWIGRLRIERRRDLGGLVIFALVGVTLFFGSLNLAIEAGGISLAVILLYTAPAFVVVLARIFLKEAITAQKVVALVLVTSGISLVALSGGGEGVTITTVSVGWGLAAGASYASYYIVGKRLMVRYEPATIYAVILPVGALGLLPFVEFRPKSAEAWALLVGLSVLSTYLAYLVYFTGLRRVEASRAVLVASMEPVIAGGLAAVIFGERLGLWGLVGAGLVVMASLSSLLKARATLEADDGEGVG